MPTQYFVLNKFSMGFLIFTCILFIYMYSDVHLENSLLILDDGNEDYTELNINQIKNKERRIIETRAIIKLRNKEQVVKNMFYIEKIFNAIIIEVRSNTIFLESLIESLRHVGGIRRSLLIFSHEAYDEDVNDIVANINFTKYIQIYYPYSVQLHPAIFPGDDSQFCSHDLKCEYNYKRRNATKAQRKHHWWWRVNFVFDHLKALKEFNGTVVFLEEDQCVTKDFNCIVTLLSEARSMVCPHCQFISLAIFGQDTNKYEQTRATFLVANLGNTEELMGVGFDRSAWNTVKQLNERFCDFNDSDWSRSLAYAAKMVAGGLSMLTIKGPRVIRFRKCPYEDETCGDLDRVENALSFLSEISHSLFPKNFTMGNSIKHISINSGGGGWEDARDRELCKYFVRMTGSE